MRDGSKKLRIVWSSDFHLGLKTDDFDRTKEIEKVMLQTIKHCVKLKKKGFDVILVWGGDFFNVNNPSEEHIAVLIGLMNYIKKYEIDSYFIVGNHDYVAQPERLSCLSFVKKAKVGYPTIKLIDDIKFVSVGTYNFGPLYFTFLPHVGKATLHGKKLPEGTTTQQYIEQKCERILKKVGQGSQHIVFSHLNVRGAHGGSEENLLKKSEVYLPECYTNTPVGYIKPTIIQGHIHTRQELDDGHLRIVGSPIYCSFGEGESEKYFLDIELGDIGVEHQYHYIPTDCTPFEQLELDMMGETRDFFELDEVKEFINRVQPESNPVVKIDVTINPENNNYNWKDIKEELEKHNYRVKPIIPRVIMKKQVRSVEQRINLAPIDAVKVYLKKNVRKDKAKAKRLFALSKKYIGE
jgi:DNA repair exonuclease SbcCD nuclease subunit